MKEQNLHKITNAFVARHEADIHLVSGGQDIMEWLEKNGGKRWKIASKVELVKSTLNIHV